MYEMALAQGCRSEHACLCADSSQLLLLQGQEVDAMHRSQAMAEAGDVDGSMVCAQQAETYKKQHETLHTSLTAPERVMTVCEVCGVFINSTDNDQRRQVRKPMSEVSANQRHLKPLSHFIACCCTGSKSHAEWQTNSVGAHHLVGCVWHVNLPPSG